MENTTLILLKSLVAPSKSPPAGETFSFAVFKALPTGEDLGGAKILGEGSKLA